jgi:hypothetical protein
LIDKGCRTALLAINAIMEEIQFIVGYSQGQKISRAERGLHEASPRSGDKELKGPRGLITDLCIPKHQ